MKELEYVTSFWRTSVHEALKPSGTDTDPQIAHPEAPVSLADAYLFTETAQLVGFTKALQRIQRAAVAG